MDISTLVLNLSIGPQFQGPGADMVIPVYYVINFLPKPGVSSQVILWFYLVT